MVAALVRLSVVSLLVVCLLSLLVRLSASRCGWLRLAAPGPARLVLLLVWLLSLVLVLPGRVWACPPPLLAVLPLFPAPLARPVAPSCLRRGVGPAARLQGGASGLWLLVPGLLVGLLLRRLRTKGHAFRARRWSICGPDAAPIARGRATAMMPSVRRAWDTVQVTRTHLHACKLPASYRQIKSAGCVFAPAHFL